MPAVSRPGLRMQVLVNGTPHDLSENSLSVADLILTLSLASKRIAVEKNGEVIPKSQHAITPVADGDRFEIIVAVGGG